ncbi:MAG: hypothetical protein DRJ60_05375 [Thermoprotei archaeon]|nr:MAG: hypothetical protein DRJ60_05375 [Thermoprotei archaeon]
MVKRTTILLEDEVYEKLVRESIRRYGSSKAISKVINELLKESLSARNELLELIHSDKVVTIAIEDFEAFRRKLSKRIESR